MTLTLVYDNEFTQPLGKEWTLYNGVPACCPTSKWDRANAVVQDGNLVLRGVRQSDGNYHTAGASLAHLNQTYGRWRFRARFDKGIGLKMCALLWPQVGFQPPEIDFAESNPGDGERTQIGATLHYPPTRGDVIRDHVNVDYSQWHTWGVTWLPGRLSFTLDNKTWGLITDADAGKVVVPTTPMHFGIQTTMGEPNKPKPDSTTPDEVDLQIDCVKVWKYT